MPTISELDLLQSPLDPGLTVIEASAGRKQICITKEATDVTMLFATAATTVEEAEAEFTDEAAALLSRRQEPVESATGATLCQG